MNESNHTTYTLRICHRCILPSGPCTLTGCSIHICLVLRSDFGLEKTDRETALDDCSWPQSTADPKTIPQQSLPILNPLRGSSHLFIFLQTLKSSLGFGILLEFAFHYVPLDQTGIKQKHFERKCASSSPSKGILKRMACDGPKLWEPETSRNPTLNLLVAQACLYSFHIYLVSVSVCSVTVQDTPLPLPSSFSPQHQWKLGWSPHQAPVASVSAKSSANQSHTTVKHVNRN